MTQTQAQRASYYRDEDDNDCLVMMDNLYLKFQESNNILTINLYNNDRLLIDFNKLLPSNCDFSYSIDKKDKEGGGSIRHIEGLVYHFEPDIKDGRYKITLLKPGGCKLKIEKERLFYPLSILHELGHANLGHTKEDRANRLLNMEIEAWVYALIQSGEKKLDSCYRIEQIGDFVHKNILSHIKKKCQ